MTARQEVTTGALPTQYAPVERANPVEISHQRCILLQEDLRTPVLDLVPYPVLIVNRYRQIVYINPAALRVINASHPGALLGLRPGEALKCVNANKTAGGCGTTIACQFCGLLRAVLSAQEGRTHREMAHLMRDDGRMLDVDVQAAPLEVAGEIFVLISLEDATERVRRSEYERFVFRGLPKRLDELAAISHLLADADPVELPTIRVRLNRVIGQIEQAITYQENLRAAEEGRLVPQYAHHKSINLLIATQSRFQKEARATKRDVRIHDDAQNFSIETDGRLVLQILNYMTQNALNATPSGAYVDLNCAVLDEGPCFSVHNPAFVPVDDQNRVFNKDFSFNGEAYGMGAAHMRILAQRVLGGLIKFTSSMDLGTAFSLILPHQPQCA